MEAPVTDCPEQKWLLLIHQIPPKPGYFRVKIWRRLQSLGAVAIKNSVYAIPKNDETLEDFHWVLKEIVQGGGEASICTADFIEGLTDGQVEDLFRTARDADYAQLSEDAKSVLNAVPANLSAATDEDRNELEASAVRLKKRFAAIKTLDFFNASGRDVAEGLLARVEEILFKLRRPSPVPGESNHDPARLSGRTWVTRRGVYVDRIACAWLISRFMDPGAQFRFVSGKGYRPRTGEVCFDMFDGEFTHRGDLCSFEVLVNQFFPNDQALAEIGKIIHDLDLKDAKFKMPETAGIGGLIDGLASAHKSDEARLERGRAMFDDLYEYFRRR